jgi:hypothetical protein
MYNSHLRGHAVSQRENMPSYASPPSPTDNVDYGLGDWKTSYSEAYISPELNRQRGPTLLESKSNGIKPETEESSVHPSAHDPVLSHDHIPPVAASRTASRANIKRYSGTMSTSTSVLSGFFGDNVYHYEELHDNEFRLLQILPARMSTIKCKIIHASLSRPPDYLAVSYAWGDAGDTRKIYVDGIQVSVTSSLFGALQALRQKSQEVLVWADAICIDQQDKDERAVQVQLMASIYTKAVSVAMWLGPEANDSPRAISLLRAIASRADSEANTREFILAKSKPPHRELSAVLSLFERDYWKRLWVVQEVFNAQNIAVYCGAEYLSWSTFQLASNAFRQLKPNLERYFRKGSQEGKPQAESDYQFTSSQVLVYQGPGSLPDLRAFMTLGAYALLEVLRACRRKLAADPRDKVFGILGVLPKEIRDEFLIDYNLSVKEVYTNVVDYVLHNTERLDVICEAIYFPLNIRAATLPSWVPDWSHIPQTGALGLSYDFRAARDSKADFKILGDRRNKLQISAIYLDTIQSQGISVGTLCTSADYLMAFLHWRALLLASQKPEDHKDELHIFQLEEMFSVTLCLGQLPSKSNRPPLWHPVCYHIFASLLRDRLPYLCLDKNLERWANRDIGLSLASQRQMLQEYCGSRMMGRCFFLTESARMGMGTGFMAPGDLVVVPLGCFTPILLRPQGDEYRFVGDVYIHGYMYGKAFDEMKAGERKLETYVLH